MKLPDGVPAQVMAHGIDSLVLALDVQWLSDETFMRLRDLKLQAKDEHAEQPALSNLGPDEAPFLCNVKPNGADGSTML